MEPVLFLHSTRAFPYQVKDVFVGIKILLADDSVTAQNMGKKILSEAGHEVVTVSNGAAAAKKIAEIKPELVLLDVFMPGYSGLELCERLRNAAETSKLPVLLTVGRMEPYSPNDGTRVKADGVIVKPFEASDLTAAVDRLAEKIKEGKPEPERAMKIVPRQESKTENSSAPAEHQQSPSANGAKLQSDREELPYEKTQRLDPSHIAAMLNKSEVSKPEDTTPLTVVPQPEFDMSGPVHSAEVQPDSVNQGGFESEQSSFGKARNETGLKEPERRFAVPSYMTQYLADHPGLEAEPPSEDKAASHAPSGTSKPASEEPSSAFAISNEVLHHSHSEIGVDPPVASATGLELTAAAPVADQPVAIAPGFEPTLQSSENEPAIAKDPALVTDLHHASMDFPTHFGTGEPELADFLVQASQEADKSAPSSADSADEFEARLNAALSSFEAPPADLPMVAPEMETPTAAFAPNRAPESPSIADSFEAQVEAAMHGFETPAAEPRLESQPSSYQLPTGPELEIIGLESEGTAELLERANDVIPEPVSEPDPITPHSEAKIILGEDETASIEVISDPVADRFESATAVHTFGADAAPEPDDAVIEQMRSSISHLPADPIHMVQNAHLEPMAFAAAANATSGSSLAPEPDAEVARAIAAALAQESLADGPTPTIPEAVAPPQSDVNHLAGAVEKIMKQELPSLVWKIMAELDLRKR
jgi:DNA-binding response OmpR family regulator